MRVAPVAVAAHAVVGAGRVDAGSARHARRGGERGVRGGHGERGGLALIHVALAALAAEPARACAVLWSRAHAAVQAAARTDRWNTIHLHYNFHLLHA